MRCKECSSNISAKACRMRNHFQKCLKTQNRKQENSDESTSEVPSLQSRSPTPSSSYSEAESVKKQKQPSVTSLLVRTSQADKLKLDKAIARYFYSCNVPFNHASRFYFKKMIEELRPGYSAPTRIDLSTTLLDDISKDVKEEAKRELQGKSVTLIQDGWSSIHNDPVIANCVTDGKNVFFLSAVDTETNHKTTDYCLKLAEEAIHECELEYGCSVKSFVSDNENKMIKLQEELVKKYSGDDNFFIAYGCAAHYLNLLGKDICNTKNINVIMKQVIEVSKYFRSHHVAKGFLNHYGGVIPQLPSETRWNSHINCLETYVRNKDMFLKIIDEHEEEVDSNIRNIINNIALYKEVKNLISMLKPIKHSLNELQRDSSTIADVTKEFLTLLECEELRNHNKFLQKRFKECITPAHILSYMLHPKHMGEGLTNDQEEVARQWVNEIDKKFLPLIVKFSIKASPFPATYFSDTIVDNLSPAEWWESLKKYNDLESISNFVCHLFHCAASSASIERIFSNFSLIQNKLRNRLGLQTASKLVMAYKMLNSKDKQLDLEELDSD